MAEMEWAIAREAELREQSYREAMLWEEGVSDALALNPVFKCDSPEDAWVEMMREAYDADDSKHPDLHSVRVDLYDTFREGK